MEPTKLIIVSIRVGGKLFSRVVRAPLGTKSFTDDEIRVLFPEAKLRRGDTYTVA